MRRRTRRIAIAATVVALVAGAAAVWLLPGSASRTRGGIAMGTLVEVTVAGPDDAPLDAWIDSAFAEIARIERIAAPKGDGKGPLIRVESSGRSFNTRRTSAGSLHI